MTLTIELTPEIEEALRVAAAAAGLDAAEYARRLLASDLGEVALPKTGLELVDYLRQSGVFGLFADRGDAQEFARQLRERSNLPPERDGSEPAPSGSRDHTEAAA